ncbi:MAG: biotin--[acetyl-CoA-carboxylase] ligase [Chitinophagaceae bacterium]
MISTGGHLTILESVDSTNNYAMAMARTGLAKHGDAFFARVQINGKGQRGKTWLTEPGANIILTVVLRTAALKLEQQFQFSAAVALAVHDFFAGYAGDETSIKWPNDIYWRDRKAGGILIESVVGRRESSDLSAESLVVNGELDGSVAFKAHDSRLSTTEWPWAIAGMGININQTVFPETLRSPVSLKQITGKDWPAVELARELCGYLQKRYEQLLAGDNLLLPYNERLYKRGQTVKFKKGSRVFEGMVKEVNAQGELVVQTAVEEHFIFGEVEWLIR